jgi:hypothetical protein
MNNIASSARSLTEGIKRQVPARFKRFSGEETEKPMPSINENTRSDLDDSFSSEDSEGSGLCVGERRGETIRDDEFLWSVRPDERISHCVPQKNKATEKARFSAFCEELYVSDEVEVADDKATKFEVEIMTRDANSMSQPKNSLSNKRKNTKKKKKKKPMRSKCPTKQNNKTKKKKKKTLRPPTEAISSCGEATMNSENVSSNMLEDSVEQSATLADAPSESPQTVSFEDQADDTDSSVKASDTKSSEADDQFDTTPLETFANRCCKMDSPRLSPSRVSNRHSVLNNKIRASLVNLGVQSAMTPSSASTRPSARHSALKSKIRASLMILGGPNMSGLQMQDDSQRSNAVYCGTSQTLSERAFSQVFQSQDLSLFSRMSVQDNGQVESLLQELQQYETELEEERNEISKERCMMQMKQEATEQMLEEELEKNSWLESQVLDLQQRLDHLEEPKDDNDTIKMLEVEVELLRQKTQRQEETIASMTLESKPNDESPPTGNYAPVHNLSGKDQGELLMLRSAFEEQSKELAKMKEQIRSHEEDQTIQELKKAVEDAERAKTYFMKETDRLNNLLAKHKKKPKKEKGWFNFGSAEDSDDEECILDLRDSQTSTVIGSASRNSFTVNEFDDSVSLLMDNSSRSQHSSSAMGLAEVE